MMCNVYDNLRGLVAKIISTHPSRNSNKGQNIKAVQNANVLHERTNTVFSSQTLI